MLLVIDVGNTNITLGVFRGEELLIQLLAVLYRNSGGENVISYRCRKYEYHVGGI